MITQEYLKSILEYDLWSGIFKWKISPSKRIRIGSIAGRLCKGYIRIKIDGKEYYAHCLAWLYVYNEYPKYPNNEIDHKNTIKSHNWISNLRKANKNQNLHNTNLRITNTSGVKGINWNKEKRKWEVRLGVNGKQKHFGFYDDLEIAKNIITIKRIEYYKEFARS